MMCKGAFIFICFRIYEYNRLNIIICTHFNSNFQGCCLSRMFGMFLQISFGSSLPLFCGSMPYLDFEVVMSKLCCWYFVVICSCKLITMGNILWTDKQANLAL